MTDDLSHRMAAFQRCIEERDVRAAEDVLDPSYALVLVQPARAVMPRDMWIKVLPEYIVHSYEIHEQIVDVDGDCAASLHRATMQATMQGNDRSGVFVISDIWRRRDGVWRVWRRHSTPSSAGALEVR